MKKHNLLSFILLGTSLISFRCDKKNETKYFSLDSKQLQEQYFPGQTISIAVLNLQNKEVDSIVYLVNDKNVASSTNGDPVKYQLKDEKFGYKNLKTIVYFEGEQQEIEARVELVSDIQPKLMQYTIVNIYPHDATSYTQGLEFYRDTLFEGTGQRGNSKLLKTDHKTGKIFQSVPLEGKYFGEGITILNNKVYQLTWQENTGFIYNAGNLQKIKSFAYFKNVEGWGLCNDGTKLYQSDGTEKIWVLDPETMKELDYLNVYSGSNKIKSVNELEWVNGKIYGNVYQKDAIAVINPQTGAVEGIVDLKELKTKVNVLDAGNDVLNGIAYNPKTKTFFITGKKWDKMFEIRIE